MNGVELIAAERKRQVEVEPTCATCAAYIKGECWNGIAFDDPDASCEEHHTLEEEKEHA
jgi:hypothetical protein